MKDSKKIIIIICFIVVILLVASIFMFKPETEKEKVKCQDILGGGFELIFVTNSSNTIENMHICIACSPSSYEDLPTPVKSGSTFDGWYYDEALTKKVEVTNTIDITPLQNKDENGCVKGYKNITLYAKWK